jgi:dienelactone hydrolase
MSHGIEYTGIMSTSHRTINLEVAGKRLSGRLVVPESADAIVVFSAGTGGAHHAGLETGLASLLHSKGVATMLVELVSLDDTDERAVRTDTETLTDRLDAQFEWIHSSDAIGEMSIALCGTGAGAAPALDYLVAGDRRVAGSAFVNGRIDHAVHPPASIASPVLFYLEDAYAHLEPQNRGAYVQAAVDDRHKQFFTATDSDDLNVVSQWFSWLFTQATARLASATTYDQSDLPLKESEGR